jgi:uncharacterized membrane protein YiaA
MEKLLMFTMRPAWIVFLCLLGIALLIVGIVTAALNVTFSGFTPIFWVLLAFGAFLGVICGELFRILAMLESRPRS